MNDNLKLKQIICLLYTEICKDILFFFSCGVFVSLFMILQTHLKQMGATSGDSWPDALFFSFISFDIAGLIFVGLLTIGSIGTLLDTFGLKWRFLDAAVTHIELRFAQITSVIISFSFGLFVIALPYSLCTDTYAGAELVLPILEFNFILFIGFFCTAAIVRRVKPFDRWRVSMLMLLIPIGLVAYLLMKGNS